MQHRLLLTLLCSFLWTLAWAQPPNNDCATAIPITQLNGQCSGAGTYSNVGATLSGQGPTGCFQNFAHDVWFSFVAQAPDVTVTINGRNVSPNGLINPEVGLLRGNCGGSLTMFHCATDAGLNNNSVEMYGGALTIGETYYIRVDAANTGVFEICVNNYFAPPTPESDCGSAVVLCDKSSFTVQSVSGAGNDASEMNNSPCGLSETNSSWYVWTVDQPGTLTFTLSPTNPGDDLDFVVYELPNGNCNQKNSVRCMAAGDFTTPSPCMGPTGLAPGNNDINENPGCSQGQNNFLAPLTVTTGQVFALVINNYTSSGNGFQISWGGTATFLGPEADMVTNRPNNRVCVGETIVFTDNSTFPNGAEGWAWNFGVGATPQVASGPGPHTVSYNRPGNKSVALTIESTRGCVTSVVETIVADACCNSVNAISTNFSYTDVVCPGANDGSVSVSGTTGYPPFTYQWNTPAVTGTGANALYAGTYAVTMTDRIGCADTFNVTLQQPPPFSVVESIVRPTCNGGTDGAISLATSGATPSYLYNWGSGFSPSNNLTNLSNGTYNVTVQDASGCDTSFSYLVTELELELDTLADFIIEPRCFGGSDGSITISMANGAAPYQFDWNDGNGFVGNNSLSNLPTGTYTLDVVDNNLCRGGPFQLFVDQPDSLIASAAATPVTCFGLSDGAVTALVQGGTPGYQYQWSAGNVADSINRSLPAGNYRLLVTDRNGCTDTASIVVTQPGAIDISNINVQDAYCYGDSNGILTITVTGGTRPFLYSVDGFNFQPDSALTDLPAGLYTVYVQDTFGCTFTRQATVSQPWIFYVDAGPDQTIELGYGTPIDALVNTLQPTTYTWTPPTGLDCTDCEDPYAQPVETTTYLVEAIDNRGCDARDSITIYVEIKRPYFVPNAFSPNFDGENDFFYVQGGPAIAEVRSLRVYDRWGGHVFEANNIPANQETYGWDGTYRGQRAPIGVYVYYIELVFVDGHVEILKGDITLLK